MLHEGTRGGGDISLGMVSEGERLRGEYLENSIISNSREHTNRATD